LKDKAHHPALSGNAVQEPYCSLNRLCLPRLLHHIEFDAILAIGSGRYREREVDEATYSSPRHEKTGQIFFGMDEAIE
jgi:hypothetical protein